MDKVERDRSLSDAQESFWAVVPAGGAGTRLWPLSRAARPKFLLPLLGHRSLLQQTVDRLTCLTPAHRILVVGSTAHAASIARQLPDLPESGVVIEPAPKGSGPAIGLAAAIIARHDPDAIMGSFAADHDIQDESAFVRAVGIAVAAARLNWLVTIGLTPSRAETGYGYIERTDKEIVATNDGGAFRAARFVEKPDLDRATAYVESGRFLWNASIFVWRVRTFLHELARLQPELHEGVMRIAASWGTAEQERVIAEIWSGLPEVTIDHGVMEHAERVAVVPAEMGWSDVGDWHGLGTLLTHDPQGNSVRGEVMNVGTSNCVVWSETGRGIALVGLDGLVVVDTAEALLVADRSKAQDVRRVISMLKQANRPELI